MIPPKDDTYFMQEALKLAQRAQDEGEIPVGCVIVAGDKIIGKGYNQTERLNDSTAHAEMLAITAAFQYLGSKYLKGCKMYVTLEPCPMCAGAANWAQISHVVYGADDPAKGFESFRSSKGKNLLHPATKVSHGIFKEQSKEMLDAFFARVRSK